jgi:hypothetical protein
MLVLLESQCSDTLASRWMQHAGAWSGMSHRSRGSRFCLHYHEWRPCRRREYPPRIECLRWTKSANGSLEQTNTVSSMGSDPWAQKIFWDHLKCIESCAVLTQRRHWDIIWKRKINLVAGIRSNPSLVISVRNFLAVSVKFSFRKNKFAFRPAVHFAPTRLWRTLN